MYNIKIHNRKADRIYEITTERVSNGCSNAGKTISEAIETVLEDAKLCQQEYPDERQILVIPRLP